VGGLYRRYYERGNTMMIGLRFRKRDALVALAVGSVIAFGLNFWFNAVATPEKIDSYLWRAYLQEPGGILAERLGRFLYSVVAYPWNVRLAVPCGYAVLVSMWTGLALAVITLGRITLGHKQQRP